MELNFYWVAIFLVCLAILAITFEFLRRNRILKSSSRSSAPRLKKKSLVFSSEDPNVFINWTAPILEIFEDRRTRAQRRKARRARTGGRRDEDLSK